MGSFRIVNKENQKGIMLETYGKGIYLSSIICKGIVALYATLPLFSFWAFAILPKIKGIWIRW